MDFPTTPTASVHHEDDAGEDGMKPSAAAAVGVATPSTIATTPGSVMMIPMDSDEDSDEEKQEEEQEQDEGEAVKKRVLSARKMAGVARPPPLTSTRASDEKQRITAARKLPVVARPPPITTRASLRGGDNEKTRILAAKKLPAVARPHPLKTTRASDEKTRARQERTMAGVARSPPPSLTASTSRVVGDEKTRARQERTMAMKAQAVKKIPPPNLTSRAAGDEKSRARQEKQLSGVARPPPPTPSNSSRGGDEKARARQERQQAMKAQGQRKSPPDKSDAAIKRSVGGTTTGKVVARTPNQTLNALDRDIDAKNRERRSIQGGKAAAKKAPAKLTTAILQQDNNRPSDAELKRRCRTSSPTNHVRQVAPPPRIEATQSMAVGMILVDEDVAEAGIPVADQDVKAKARAASGRAQPRPGRRHTATDLSRGSTAARPNRRSTTTSIPPRTLSTGSAVSSVGAHSATGGNRDSKTCKSDEELDGVEQHLASLPRNSATGIQMIPFQEDTDDEYASEHEGMKDSSRFSVRTPTIEGDEYYEEYEEGKFEDDDDDELEAQVGIPIMVTPGAFAVEGDEGGVDLLEDDDDDDVPVPSDAALAPMDPDSGAFVVAPDSGAFVAPADPVHSHLFFDPDAAQEELEANALEAELHEVVVFEAQVCSFEDDHEAHIKKNKRRMKCIGLCLCLAVIAAVMVAISQSKNGKDTSESSVPTIEGWNQVGMNLTGPTDDDKSLFGYDIAMDGQAQRIAIGVPGRDQGVSELSVGEVQILDWNGTQWVQPHLPIFGPGPESRAGEAVTLSKNGKRVAVGSPFFSPGGGHVAVYEEVEPTNWEMVGQDLVASIENHHVDERFGSSLALSEDGSILAVGANMGDGADGVDTGYVKVFQLQETAGGTPPQQWVQLGNTIYGENPSDFFGWSLDMSSDGKRVVVGAVGSSAGGVGEYAGQVRVFDYDSSTWVQTGPAMTGMAAFESFGSSVSMSGDGSTIAVGAIGHSNDENGVDVGHVRVFRFAGTSWEPLGQPLIGQSAFDSFGHSVSLSDDGKVVAAGGPRSDEFSESSGQIQVFELDGSTLAWDRRGSNIGGSYKESDLFGWSVALSADGSVVAGGAPFSTFDGHLNDVGTVRIYDVEE